MSALSGSLNCVLPRQLAKYLFQHGEYFSRLHVQHLRDAALHDQKVWVVHIELNGEEEILYAALLRNVPVNQILVFSANGNLRAATVSAKE